ncbi:hypothetical protein OSB04_023414 [Centaurea solstitialis]|uniref:Nodulin-like domain-containing protein n=1 Tax=Centaurea solstitialis TaxID=347529 RepID=A0AA38W292_9ASTR|nr:hypothetical protein OSB04_023414 [Centaurea solstitialis]
MALQWLSLVGIIWLQAISATNSNFPAYSSQLKLLLSLSQLQLNNLAFASDAGKLFGFFSGMAAIYLPLWLVLLIGSLLGFIGYGVQYLFLVTNNISYLPYSLVFLLTVLAGNSICWINTVCYVIAIQNFPLNRQLAVGLSTSYQGLSAKIYLDVVDVVFNSPSRIDSDGGGAKSYLLSNSILPLVNKCDESSIDVEGTNGGVDIEQAVKDEGVLVNDGEEMGVKVMMKKLNFWLYFFVYMFGATIGMVYLNNLGQIAESRGGSNTSSLVSLTSSFGFFGRLFPCLLDYHLSRAKYKVSRPALIALMMVPMTTAFFLLLNSSNICLYISTATIGICTGAITSISVSTTAELFGTKSFGVNHNVVVTNIPIGSLLFGKMAALLYREQGLTSGNGKCMGVKCYQTNNLTMEQSPIRARKEIRN